MRLIERIAVYDAIEKGLTTDEIYYRVRFLPDTPAIPISVIEQIKAEIKTHISDGDMYADNTTGEIACIDSTLLLCLEIIDRHIKEYTDGR